MTWIKLDTAIFRHKKVSALRDAEQLAYVRLLAWAGESSDDGHVPDTAMRIIPMTARQAQALEAVGLLHRNGTGYHIHDWDDHQGSLLERRRREARRQRELRARRKGDADA